MNDETKSADRKKCKAWPKRRKEQLFEIYGTGDHFGLPILVDAFDLSLDNYEMRRTAYGLLAPLDNQELDCDVPVTLWFSTPSEKPPVQHALAQKSPRAGQSCREHDNYFGWLEFTSTWNKALDGFHDPIINSVIYLNADQLKALDAAISLSRGAERSQMPGDLGKVAFVPSFFCNADDFIVDMSDKHFSAIYNVCSVRTEIRLVFDHQNLEKHSRW